MIATHYVPQTQADYEKVIGLRDRLFNANGALFIAVVVWWIVVLWIDEPGAKSEEPVEIPAEAAEKKETS